MSTVPLSSYTGTVGRGFSVDPVSGDIVLDSGVRYHAENGREIPIKMSLSGYAYALTRTENGVSVKVADILEHREVDRFEPMRIKPVDNAAAKRILDDIRPLSIDLSTARIEGKVPPPGTFKEMSPAMFCSVVWECHILAADIAEQVSNGIMLYRNPKTELFRWNSLDTSSGVIPYMKESVEHVLKTSEARGIRAEDVIFANVWFGQPDFASNWIAQRNQSSLSRNLHRE